MLKILRRIFYTLATLVATYLTVGGFLALYPNFHTVIPGKVYRSAQLNKREFLYYIKKNHIKSVINLRGSANRSNWYHQEIAATQQTNIKHYDLHLRAMKTNSKQHMLALVKLLETSPKPVLVHCWHGADRTGLASAMAIILLTNKPLTAAERQTTFRFLALDPRSTEKVEITLYKKWLQQHRLSNSKSHFLQWLRNLPS